MININDKVIPADFFYNKVYNEQLKRSILLKSFTYEDFFFIININQKQEELSLYSYEEEKIKEIIINTFYNLNKEQMFNNKTINDILYDFDLYKELLNLLILNINFTMLNFENTNIDDDKKYLKIEKVYNNKNNIILYKKYTNNYDYKIEKRIINNINLSIDNNYKTYLKNSYLQTLFILSDKLKTNINEIKKMPFHIVNGYFIYYELKYEEIERMSKK